MYLQTYTSMQFFQSIYLLQFSSTLLQTLNSFQFLFLLGTLLFYFTCTLHFALVIFRLIRILFTFIALKLCISFLLFGFITQYISTCEDIVHSFLIALAFEGFLFWFHSWSYLNFLRCFYFAWNSECTDHLFK